MPTFDDETHQKIGMILARLDQAEVDRGVMSKDIGELKTSVQALVSRNTLHDKISSSAMSFGKLLFGLLTISGVYQAFSWVRTHVAW